MTLFFALLALASLATVAAAVLLRLLAPVSPGAAGALARVRAELADQGVALAAVVALVASLGSLYLSEVAGFRPCSLCWVQRGFMYPLALALGAAAWAGWAGIRRPARLWALAGAAVSLWHILLERLPALQGTAVCDVANPCWLRWVDHFGFVTIPVMAFAAFLLVATLLSVPAAVPAASTEERELVP